MTTINLPYGYTPRHYQEEPWNNILAPDFMRGLMVVPRRNGKDLTCWNALICKAVQKPALYYYMAPYYNQVRQIIWEGFSGERRFLDYIPRELIKNKTKLDMRIDLVNGSQIKLQGSDTIDRIVGTNPYGIVFTEFSLHKPEAWEYLRPILAENGGWALFNGTPRSLNHFFDLYTYANTSQGTYNWYVQFLTRDDTGVPTKEAIDEDRRSGMPEELIQQEYYCSFTSGGVGSYYGDVINTLRGNGHLTRVPHDPRLDVFTAWDLGYDDSTAIWFAQIFKREIRLIDYYEDHHKSLKHYIKICKEKPYVYEEHFAPHDIEVHDYSTGVSRRDTAAELGFDFTTTPRHTLEDGHEWVREMLPQCYFDSGKTSMGFNALLGYKQKYDTKLDAYSEKPERNKAKHGADAFRTLAANIDNMRDGGNVDKPKVRRAFRPMVKRSIAA
jgi:hypothetical protein